LFTAVRNAAHRSSLDAFKSSMSSEFYDFVTYASREKERCERAFTVVLEEACIEGTNWSWEADRDQLRSELTQIIEKTSFDIVEVRMLYVNDVIASYQSAGSQTSNVTSLTSLEVNFVIPRTICGRR
jgi:hypothetical protein